MSFKSISSIFYPCCTHPAFLALYEWIQQYQRESLDCDISHHTFWMSEGKCLSSPSGIHWFTKSLHFFDFFRRLNLPCLLWYKEIRSSIKVLSDILYDWLFCHQVSTFYKVNWTKIRNFVTVNLHQCNLFEFQKEHLLIFKLFVVQLTLFYLHQTDF